VLREAANFWPPDHPGINSLLASCFCHSALNDFNCRRRRKPARETMGISLASGGPLNPERSSLPPCRSAARPHRQPAHRRRSNNYPRLEPPLPFPSLPFPSLPFPSLPFPCLPFLSLPFPSLYEPDRPINRPTAITTTAAPGHDAIGYVSILRRGTATSHLTANTTSEGSEHPQL
jgi:hypothetical protein